MLMLLARTVHTQVDFGTCLALSSLEDNT